MVVWEKLNEWWLMLSLMKLKVYACRLPASIAACFFASFHPCTLEWSECPFADVIVCLLASSLSSSSSSSFCDNCAWLRPRAVHNHLWQNSKARENTGKDNTRMAMLLAMPTFSKAVMLVFMGNGQNGQVRAASGRQHPSNPSAHSGHCSKLATKCGGSHLPAEKENNKRTDIFFEIVHTYVVMMLEEFPFCCIWTQLAWSAWSGYDDSMEYTVKEWCQVSYTEKSVNEVDLVAQTYSDTA